MNEAMTLAQAHALLLLGAALAALLIGIGGTLFWQRWQRHRRFERFLSGMEQRGSQRVTLAPPNNVRLFGTNPDGTLRTREADPYAAARYR